jgi:tRNA threonylcarbamoyladenosine biosynthesis protein TsaE
LLDPAPGHYNDRMTFPDRQDTQRGLMPMTLADEQATAGLGRRLAGLARPRDVIALRGGLGLGKTTLARAFIQAFTDSAEEVPSPTFTLVQTYDAPRGTVWHIDAYRLKAPDEIWELGFEEALADAILLIEWPEKLGPHLPAKRLDLTLEPGATPQSRHVRLEGAPGTDWTTRLEGSAP